jgi:hypothetical protein
MPVKEGLFLSDIILKENPGTDLFAYEVLCQHFLDRAAVSLNAVL